MSKHFFVLREVVHAKRALFVSATFGLNTSIDQDIHHVTSNSTHNFPFSMRMNCE